MFDVRGAPGLTNAPGSDAGAAQAPEALLEGFRQYLLMIAGQELPPGLRAKVGASDLVQDTLIKAHEHIGRFQGATDADLRGWLRRILLNQLADTARHYCGTHRRDLTREVSLNRATAETLSAPGESPSRHVMARERDEALRRALDRLHPDDRRLIVLRTHQHLSFEEVGRQTGRTPEAARKAWARAVERLAVLLGSGHDQG